VKVGDLVRTKKCIEVGAQGSVSPSDVGVVLSVFEPTVQFAQGTAEVVYPVIGQVSLMWKELEVLSEGR